MAAQLHVVVREMTHPLGFDEKARKLLDPLEKICPRITSFNLTLSESSHHRNGGRFSLKLDVRAPGLELVVTRDHQEDVYVALREACQAARRQLREQMERAQGGDKARRATGAADARGNE